MKTKRHGLGFLVRCTLSTAKHEGLGARNAVPARSQTRPYSYLGGHCVDAAKGALLEMFVLVGGDGSALK